MLTLLLPLAVLIGFGGLAFGGRVGQIGVIVAAILAGVYVLYLLLQA